MNIWHVCPSPIDVAREQGGVSNVVRALAVEMSSLGLGTTVLCGDCELGRRIQPAGIHSPAPNLKIMTLRQRRNPAWGPLTELGRIIARIPKGDVAHVHTCFSAFADYAMYALARRAIPFVFSPHGKLSEAALQTRGLSKLIWWRTISRPGISRARRIGVNAEAEASDARRAGLRQAAFVIPNGCSPPRGDGWRRSVPLIFGPYILFLGYLDPRKRPELLIDALARLHFRQSLRLVFVGPDPYGFGARLREIARDADLGDRVVFYGPAYGEEKWNLLANAVCLCLPSRAEGMPLVVTEAVGAGIPLIVSPQCNATGLVEAGAGIEIGEPNGVAWAAGIDRLLSAPGEIARMKDAAALISADYAWDRIAARWAEAYRTIASEVDNDDRVVIPGSVRASSG